MAHALRVEHTNIQLITPWVCMHKGNQHVCVSACYQATYLIFKSVSFHYLHYVNFTEYVNIVQKVRYTTTVPEITSIQEVTKDAVQDNNFSDNSMQ